MVIGGPDHFIPWLAEIERQANEIRATNPALLTNTGGAQSQYDLPYEMFAAATMGDFQGIRLKLARNLLPKMDQLNALFMGLVYDPLFRQLAKQWLQSKNLE
jgi:hypothetical protein